MAGYALLEALRRPTLPMRRGPTKEEKRRLDLQERAMDLEERRLAKAERAEAPPKSLPRKSTAGPPEALPSKPPAPRIGYRPTQPPTQREPVGGAIMTGAYGGQQMGRVLPPTAPGYEGPSGPQHQISRGPSELGVNPLPYTVESGRAPLELEKGPEQLKYRPGPSSTVSGPGKPREPKDWERSPKEQEKILEWQKKQAEAKKEMEPPKPTKPLSRDEVNFMVEDLLARTVGQDPAVTEAETKELIQIAQTHEDPGVRRNAAALYNEYMKRIRAQPPELEE